MPVESLWASKTKADGKDGESVKWVASAQSTLNRWRVFLDRYGEAAGFKEGDSPSIELVELFVTYSFKCRMRSSTSGKEGRGDSVDLHNRYLLAKFVFPYLGYEGWVGLSRAQLVEKSKPYQVAAKVA